MFYELKQFTPGLGLKHKIILLKRLELTNSTSINLTYINSFKSLYKKNLVFLLNSYYSQINSVNDQLNNLLLLNVVRLYLIKTYRGKCHLLGKPTRGQRTWSNGWTSYKYNLILRRFVSETKSKLSKDKKVEKINYKLIKKKYGIKKTFKKKINKKTLLWL
jgi:ribosomal protein S13